MKRCVACNLDYPLSYAVCPVDGARLEEVPSSTAVAPIIEIRAASPPRGEEVKSGGVRELSKEVFELLSDFRWHRLHFERGPGRVELRLSRAAVSVGLATLGISIFCVGFSLLLLAGMVSGSSWGWWDTIFAVAFAWLIVPYWLSLPCRRIGRSWACGIIGFILFLNAVGALHMNVLPVVITALGMFLVLRWERMPISGLTVRFIHY